MSLAPLLQPPNGYQLYNIARECEDNKNYVDMIANLKVAVQKKNVKAMIKLAELYSTGVYEFYYVFFYVTHMERNVDKAIELYTQPELKDIPEAKIGLAKLLEANLNANYIKYLYLYLFRSRTLEATKNRIMNLYKEAADMNDGSAIYKLVELLKVSKKEMNVTEMYNLLVRSANLGNIDAAFAAANLVLKEGENIQKNNMRINKDIVAIEFLLKGCEHNDPRAINLLETLLQKSNMPNILQELMHKYKAHDKMEEEYERMRKELDKQRKVVYQYKQMAFTCLKEQVLTVPITYENMDDHLDDTVAELSE